MSDQQRTEYDDDIDDAIELLIAENDAHAVLTGSLAEDSGIDADVNMATKTGLSRENLTQLHGVLLEYHAEALSEMTNVPLPVIVAFLSEKAVPHPETE